jgi:hypothetical protein
LMSNHKDLLREMGIEFQTKDFVETILWENFNNLQQKLRSELGKATKTPISNEEQTTASALIRLITYFGEASSTRTTGTFE